MKRILIVDDEPIARQHIRASFPWEAWGAYIAGEAANGEEALRMCREVNPDVALIDITMPVMDGLTLLEQLRSQFPQVRCIMLTAHRDFEYAQQAMAGGALGYILKSPIDLKAARTALERAYSDIEKESELTANISLRNSLIRNYRYPLRKEFLENVLSGILSRRDEMLKRGEELELRLQADYYTLCLFRIDHLSQYAVKYQPKELPLIEFSMLEIIREVLDGLALGQFELFPCRFGTAAVLFTGSRAPFTPAAISEWWAECQAPLRQYMSIGLGAACSNPFTNLARLRMEFVQTEKLLEHRFYQEQPRPVFAQGLAPFQEPPKEPVLAAAESFGEAWHSPQPAEWERWIRSARDLLLTYRPHPQWARSWLKEQIAALPEPELREAAAVAEDATLHECLSALRDAVLDWRTKEQHKKQLRPEIAAAIQFIRHNLDQELTLDLIAGKIQLSTSHLGHLFKKETGFSVIDYILDQRIEAAKAWLLNGTYRNYELAEKVGFNSYSYFCTVFKKHTGLTPNEFKQANKPFIST
ncbi:response regulator [Paenibacillus sp. YN15]|uniref:response regulator n=1 Tax=Paenibacillus sp. YN15 TaxID=1742774 RepID=UPI000DCB5F81|nr:response regulator [Paenibacillus sp. YN15]RAV04048.1 hypothetical protein DQG13_06090 [Paenibacillus sp. YN15]